MVYLSIDRSIDLSSGILAIKKNEILDLEGIMLTEISQLAKDKYCMISLIRGI